MQGVLVSFRPVKAKHREDPDSAVGLPYAPVLLRPEEARVHSWPVDEGLGGVAPHGRHLGAMWSETQWTRSTRSNDLTKCISSAGVQDRLDVLRCPPAADHYLGGHSGAEHPDELRCRDPAECKREQVRLQVGELRGLNRGLQGAEPRCPMVSRGSSQPSFRRRPGVQLPALPASRGVDASPRATRDARTSMSSPDSSGSRAFGGECWRAVDLGTGPGQAEGLCADEGLRGD